MTGELIVTREISPLPERRDDAHKGDFGRIVVIGGCNGQVTMIGAPALVANAALASGTGLVQMFVPKTILNAVGVLVPCATMRSVPKDVEKILAAAGEFQADVLAIGPGLGNTLKPEGVFEVINSFGGPVVVDADALNRLAEVPEAKFVQPHRIVLTPHPGEAARLLEARQIHRAIERAETSRRVAAHALHEAYGCVVVLKGHGTIVTNGDRIYTNETGNSGMATPGAGDVLTGVIAGLIGQRMDPFEAAILGVYLHGFAGDFAAEELGRWSMTATDILDYLPEAFCEHAAAVEP
ncbi:MAG: NAD(P)H-hydrate dehydratase [Planctomycetes bacterium]|nr:NAD(P)H-hydrate dehydratase [Planctomycetota bacterium]MBI3834730.1 NAD(P)H-hydrate dehydratase [Planctomycetota bacterium]